MSAFRDRNGVSLITDTTPSITIDRPAGSQPTSPIEKCVGTGQNEMAEDSTPRQLPAFSSPLSPSIPRSFESHKRKRSESREPARRSPSKTEHGPDAASPTRREARRSQRAFSEHALDEEPNYRTQATVGDTNDQYERRRSSMVSTRRSPGDDYNEESPLADGGHDYQSDKANNHSDAEDRTSSYVTEFRHEDILHHDPKKRKRNFSNRTKTGCLTCRRRKKKCGEEKPECANCIKGGFDCAGYQSQMGPDVLPKAESKPGVIAIESADPSYRPPGAYGMPRPNHDSPNAQVKRDSLSYRGQSLRIDPPTGRALVADDERPTASTYTSASAISPENKISSLSFPQASPFPTPISANPQPLPLFGADRISKGYSPRMLALHDRGRNETDLPSHSGSQLPQIAIFPPRRASSPQRHSSTMAPTPGPVPQSGTQLALVQTHLPPRRTQKEEMLRGRLYYPFDKELCLERERCATACWKFNNLTYPPTNGVSPEERARLFMEILAPREPVRISPHEASPITNVGRVGSHVVVETPFICDYGYNISIGHSVSIGRNCTINDVCEVKIGDNVVIGPNVSILCASLPTDPRKRQGGQGPQMGKAVIIEEECWIGGGATILPGRIIGRGSTVGAGSIVTKDVPPFTIVAGNPARVLRGVGA